MRSNAFETKSHDQVAALSQGGSLYAEHVKRVLDVTLVVLSLPLVVLVIAIAAVAVALTGGNPFYTQDRVGRDGRLFRIFKLRTMVPDADALLERYLAENPQARREWDATQKLRDDPRIIPVGKFLRKTSMDELPQLFNVLRGDMSLIGPRPMMPSQQSLYPGTSYYKLRPGITGAWQVSERNQSEFVARARYDAEYLKTLSFTTDAAILMRTVGVVARGTGC